MNLSVEISNYPLSEDYIPAIKSFIERLNQHDNLTVITNTMSTQIFGEYDYLMQVLSAEMKKSYEQFGKNIFVCKFINADLTPSQ
ncbi:hypothetical protein [Flocculibacter collagenilyticus]|uniref:hypothetical protein n=1 Tax=Flocculibacter collagenilyticus TaxID=2744479 RepID=UPI0018F4C892|nr:hypothetical protein [Flocculibacter collagenilyticus]